MGIVSRFVAALGLVAVSIIIVDTQNCGSCQIVGRFCYAFNSNKIANADAIAQCTAAGGRLPFFSTAQDLTDFASFATSVNLGASWLGYWNPNPHSGVNPGIWKDQLGNDGTYYNWAPTQPDNYGPVGEHCVQTYPMGQWNDINCANTFQVVCQCQCPTPTGLNMHHTGGDPPAINSVISLSCDTCYQLIGPATATCQYNGKSLVWNANVPSSYCSRIQCPPLFTGSTGTYLGTPYLSCTSYTYTCIANYIVDARNVFSETYGCSATGTWDKTFIPCTMITCADWNGLVNGKVAYSLNSVGLNRWPINTRAGFSCNLGYDLMGSISSICISNNVWNQPTKPYCRQITCADWNVLGNGTVRYSPNSPVANRWPFNTHVDFTCNLGYELIGMSSSICISNDNWSPSIKPHCQRRICNATFFYDTTTGTPESSAPYYSLTQCQFNCKTNFVCVWNNFSIYHCEANGHWKEPKLQLCQGTCAPLPHIANITLIYSSTYNDNNSLERPVVGSKLNLTCQKGFMMRLPTRTPVNFETKEGPLPQECLTTQLWKRAPPYCVEMNNNDTVPIELPCDPQMYTDCPAFITPDNLVDFKKTIEKIKPFPEFNFDSDMPPGSAMRKFVKVTYSMGCMAVMIVLSIAVGIAVLRQNFDNSLEFVNFCTTVVLLLSYIVFMAVIDRQGPLVNVLNQGGCMIFAYCLEFLFLCCFLLKIFKAIELLGIFGNILSNENMIRPFYIAFVVFWSSFFFTLFTFMGIGTDISNDSTCLLNLNSRIITVVLMSFCAFASWLAFIVVEASGCSPFEVLRIGRQEERSKLSFLDYLRVMTYAEVPVTFFAWLTNIYAQFTQQFAWYPIAFGLNIVAGVLALQCQFGAGVAVKSALLRLKKRLKAKRMKMSCKEIMKLIWHRK